MEWTSQEQIIEFIASNLPSDLALVVRLHPHMCDKNKDNLLSWKKLESSFVENGMQVRFVWHDSAVNSYLLAACAER